MRNFRFKRKDLIIIFTIVGTIIVFIIPFFLRSSGDNLFSVLSLSFTIIGSVATLATFIVAILLYDKFGLEQKFINQQTDKVLELVYALKGKMINAKTKGYEYMILPSVERLELFKSMPFFKNDSEKLILFHEDDYHLGTKEIMAIKRSPWLPQIIKEKMEFFEVGMLINMNGNSIENFVLLDMNTGVKGNIGIAFPKQTFAEFCNVLQDLIITIENWLRKNSSVIVDFKMEEP